MLPCSSGGLVQMKCELQLCLVHKGVTKGSGGLRSHISALCLALEELLWDDM